MRMPRMGMSECGAKYAMAVAEPFSVGAMGACLPFSPEFDSQKVTAITRFNLVASSTGNAWVLFSPCVVNDAYAYWTSGSAGLGTFPMTLVSTNTPPANYAGGQFSTIPYVGNDLMGNSTKQVDARIVSVGFRITYTGNVSSMGGMYYSFCDPAHANVNSSYFSPTGEVFTALETKITRVTDTPFEQGFTCVTPEERGYVGNLTWRRSATAGGDITAWYPWCANCDINGIAHGTVNNGAAPIVFGVSGAVSGATFYVELIEHLEYVGKGASVGLTPSHNDDIAAEKISAAAGRATGEFQAHPEKTWSQTFMTVLNDTMSYASTPMGRSIMSAALKGALVGLGRRRGHLKQSS